MRTKSITRFIIHPYHWVALLFVIMMENIVVSGQEFRLPLYNGEIPNVMPPDKLW